MTIKWPENIPTSEFSEPFVQGMADRMAVSYCKYGAMKDATSVDKLASLRKRLEKYEQDGNTEWLMDVANFALMEFVHPRHPDAHFTPTDGKASPGRQWTGDVDPSQRGNRPETWR